MTEIIEYTTAATDIDGLVVITMKQVTDERGTVRELFRRSAFDGAGVAGFGPFRQINVTETHRGGLRGMHAESMTKLIAVVAGRGFGAFVDLRQESTTYGTVATVDLVPGTQVLVPAGVGNGFQSLVDGMQYAYCFDQEWQPGMAGTSCNPLDPALAIDWPIAVDPDNRAQVSAKDLAAPSFAELAAKPQVPVTLGYREDAVQLFDQPVAVGSGRPFLSRMRSWLPPKRRPTRTGGGRRA